MNEVFGPTVVILVLLFLNWIEKENIEGTKICIC